MDAVKSNTDMVECYGCHQLVMFNATQTIPLADGPDDFVNTSMCDDCAETFEKDTPEWEPEDDEAKPISTVDECTSKETRSMHKLL